MAAKMKINKEHTLHDLTSLAQTMQPLIKQLLGDKGLLLIELLRNWNLIVGADLAQYTLPHKLSFPLEQRCDGTLYLTTLSGAFAMEVQQRTLQIIRQVNQFFGYTAVSKLKILQTGNPEDLQPHKKTLEYVQKNVVSAAEENYITDITKDIDSPELRERLRNLGRLVFNQNQE